MAVSTGYSLINTAANPVWYDGLYHAPNTARVISYSDVIGGITSDAQLQVDLLSAVTLIGLSSNMAAAYGGQPAVDKLVSLNQSQSTVAGISYETISAVNNNGIIESVFSDTDILVGVI